MISAEGGISSLDLTSLGIDASLVEVAAVAVDSIVVEDSLRGDLGDLSSLEASIAAVGVLQPLVVCRRPGDFPDGPFFSLVAGRRRLRACSGLGWDSVPCVIMPELDFVRRGVVALVENLVREDLDPVEVAEGYRRLVDAGMSRKEVAACFGVSQASVSQHIGLLSLPLDIRNLIASGAVSFSAGRELCRLLGFAWSSDFFGFFACRCGDSDAGVVPSRIVGFSEPYSLGAFFDRSDSGVVRYFASADEILFARTWEGSDSSHSCFFGIGGFLYCCRSCRDACHRAFLVSRSPREPPEPAAGDSDARVSAADAERAVDVSVLGGPDGRYRRAFDAWFAGLCAVVMDYARGVFERFSRDYPSCVSELVSFLPLMIRGVPASAVFLSSGGDRVSLGDFLSLPPADIFAAFFAGRLCGSSGLAVGDIESSLVSYRSAGVFFPDELSDFERFLDAHPLCGGEWDSQEGPDEPGLRGYRLSLPRVHEGYIF